MNINSELHADLSKPRTTVFTTPSPECERPVVGTGLSVQAEQTTNDAESITQARMSQISAASAVGDQSKQSGTSPPFYGATNAEWQAFTQLAREDCLPVVSDLTTKISPNSTIKALGKVPSLVNGRGQAIGFPAWPSHRSTQEDIEKWRKDSRLGICLATRRVRALDVDIHNARIAGYVFDEIEKFGFKMPKRSRSNSSKFLLLFEMQGDYAKRVIRCDDGQIEFLATGQQCIVAGMHTSGVRYEWLGNLPQEIPTLMPEQFERLWKQLHQCFAADIDAPFDTTPAAVNRATKLANAAKNDSVAQVLIGKGATTERDGKLLLPCPFADGHTPGGDDTVAYFPAHTGGYERGHFRCLHASCNGRKDGDFLDALGIEAASADEFTIEAPAASSTSGDGGDAFPVEEGEQPACKYKIEEWGALALLPAPGYLIHGVIPKAGLVTLFGESGSGKTFLALDFAAAIQRGIEWRGRKVKQGNVVYIAAEDASGVIMRMRAYAMKHGITPEDMPIGVLNDAPNLTQKEDTTEVLKSIRARGVPVSLIIVDTLAQVTSGSDENSGQDMGRLLGYCRSLHRSTGAVVMLIHHSGKDASKGARGHSSLRGASDAMIEVTRCDQDRVASMYKLKNGDETQEFGFRLYPVVVDQDGDGDDIISCVLDHTEAKPKWQRKKAVKGTNERIVVEMMNTLEVGGKVDYSTLKQACIDQKPIDAGRARTKDDRRGEVMGRAIGNLIADGRFETDGRFVWSTTI